MKILAYLERTALALGSVAFLSVEASRVKYLFVCEL